MSSEKTLIGIVSEILLLAGILSLALSAYLGFHCENTFCPLAMFQFERQLSYLAFVLLAIDDYSSMPAIKRRQVC